MKGRTRHLERGEQVPGQTLAHEPAEKPLVAAVEFVADDGKARMAQMHTNLMEPSRFGERAYERVIAE